MTLRAQKEGGKRIVRREREREAKSWMKRLSSRDFPLSRTLSLFRKKLR